MVFAFLDKCIPLVPKIFVISLVTRFIGDIMNLDKYVTMFIEDIMNLNT